MLPVPFWWKLSAFPSYINCIASLDLSRVCLGKDLPFDGEVSLFAFKLPGVFAKFCVFLACFVVEPYLMVFNLALNSMAASPTAKVSVLVSGITLAR